MAAPMDINWSPPDCFYLFQADTYCGPCGAALVERCKETLPPVLFNGRLVTLAPWDYEDSNSWPQKYPRWLGENDTPDHCGHCHRFLGRTLTDDGVDYVKQAAMGDIDQYGAIGEVVQGWLDYYDLDLDGYYGADGVCLASAVGIECEYEPEEA